MILTGPRIEELIACGDIEIDPLDRSAVGPNSVDLRLHEDLLTYEDYILDMRNENAVGKERIPDHGLVLVPGVLYLARTVERVGSDKYVPMVEGRSSAGRLGLQVHMTAGFCDTGFHGTITLEMTVVHPLRVYPGVRIAQVFFLRPEGAIRLYEGRYQGHVDPTPSRMHEPTR